MPTSLGFFANAASDPSGHGQGQVYLGYATVTTNFSGTGSFSAVLSMAGAPGKFISATATAIKGSNTATNLSFGDTSEFAASIQAF